MHTKTWGKRWLETRYIIEQRESSGEGKAEWMGVDLHRPLHGGWKRAITWVLRTGCSFVTRDLDAWKYIGQCWLHRNQTKVIKMEPTMQTDVSEGWLVPVNGQSKYLPARFRLRVAEVHTRAYAGIRLRRWTMSTAVEGAWTRTCILIFIRRMSKRSWHVVIFIDTNRRQRWTHTYSAWCNSQNV